MPVEAPGIVDEALPPAVELPAQIVDWNALEITEIYDEYEGRLEIIEDDHVFRLLGLRDEEEKAEKARKDAGVGGMPAETPADKAYCHLGVDTAGASLLVDDFIP